MKNFVEQISIKFGGFYKIRDEFGTYCAVDKHTKISVDICISADIEKVKYRAIISVDRYIGRSLVWTTPPDSYGRTIVHHILSTVV